MKSSLSVNHLLRHYLLFVFTVLFLLSIARSGYSLWQINRFEDAQTLVQSLLMGIRFDVAAVGIILLVPIFIVPLFAMSRWSLGLARILSMVWLMLALLAILFFELITPYFIEQSGVRPDWNVLSSLENPLQAFSHLWSRYLIQSVIGVILLVLVMIAFWNRLESTRFLRYPVKKLPAIFCSLIGVAVCAVAIRSTFDLQQPPLDASAALVSADPVVNEITLSSSFKALSSLYSYIPTIQSQLKLP